MKVIESVIAILLLGGLVLTAAVGCKPKEMAESQLDNPKSDPSAAAAAPAEEEAVSASGANEAPAPKDVNGAPSPAAADEVSRPEDCSECRTWACSSYSGFKLIDRCYKGDDAELCKMVVDCADRTGCANQDVADCYCGKDHEMAECLAQGGPGVCKDEVVKAAKTEVSTEVATRYMNPQYPLGRAMSLLGCYQELCPHCVKGDETPLDAKGK